MCIVIDVCTLPDVFDAKSANHTSFSPVLQWILRHNGKLIYGGTKYKNELKRTKYIKTFIEFKKAGKVVDLDDAEVDLQHNQIAAMRIASKYNDHHLVAIVIVSRCHLVCTKDNGAMKLLREKGVYPVNFKRPSIYSRFSNRSLLCDMNIVGRCLD